MLNSTGNCFPPEYYADAEQVAGPFEADLLTLREPASLFPSGDDSGRVAVLDARPHARERLAVRPRAERPRTRRLVIRHTSGHRVVALIEIASPSNKDRASAVAEFAGKAVAALRQGIHVLLADLFPPGRHAPTGLAGAIVEELRDESEADSPTVGVTVPANEPLGFASFEAGPEVAVYLEPRAVGAELPTMPLFLATGFYINVPLGVSYHRAWSETPRIWRDVLAPPTTVG